MLTNANFTSVYVLGDFSQMFQCCLVEQGSNVVSSPPNPLSSLSFSSLLPYQAQNTLFS
jgi:hypothetical protein